MKPRRSEGGSARPHRACVMLPSRRVESQGSKVEKLSSRGVEELRTCSILTLDFEHDAGHGDVGAALSRHLAR